MTIVAETRRLVLRELSTEEAEAFYALNDDPEVIRHTGDGPFADVDEARRFLADYDVYARRGYGRWSVYLKETGEYLGWCGLGYRPERDEVDIGFRFARRHWGKGYATEAAITALELGFKRHGLATIVGRAMEGNVASHRVLAKLGMTPAFTFEQGGERWVQYELTADTFRARDASA